MDVYENNLQYLKQHNPDVYKTILASAPVYQSVTEFIDDAGNALVKTADGQCFLHSLYDCQREMDRQFAPLARDTRALVLFGLGLGDALNYIADELPALEVLVIIEPNLTVFKAFLARENLRKRGLNCKVFFLVNQPVAAAQDALLRLMQTQFQGAIQAMELSASVSYRTLYPDYYQAIQAMMVDAIRRTTVNLATRSLFTYRWIANEWLNQRHDSVTWEDLAKHLPPLPMILVSAGPSLSNNINLLAKAKQRAVIVAVGSAMTILESHGIVPHFRMAVDANDSCRSVLAAVNSTACPLIYSNMIDAKALSGYTGPKIQMVLETDWLTQYLRKLQQSPGIILKTGYSVANIAFDLACRWGCPKIIFVGQDLCYTGRKVHAAGAWDDFNHGVAPEEINALDIHGRSVYTSRVYLGMKSVFEEFIRLNPHIRCLNATEGGLPIAGCPNKPLRQVIEEELTAPQDIEGLIDAALKNCDSVRNKVAEVLHIAVGELAEIASVNDRRLEELIPLQALPEDQLGSEKVTRQLEEIRRLGARLEDIGYYWDVLYPYLANTLTAIEFRHEYNGADKAKQAVALIKTFAGQIAEVQRFADHNLNLAKRLEKKVPYSVLRELM
jgi:hypothetical protein